MTLPTVFCEGCGKNIHDTRRYDVESLAAATRESVNTCLRKVGISGKSMQEARCHGLTHKVADRLAATAGLHPYVVWPEMADHDAERFQKSCAECGALFFPYHPSRQKYC